MGVDDWRKNFNKKLDDFGEDAMRKVRQQREVNAGGSTSTPKVGLQDRMNMLKGQDPRWSRDVESRASAAAGEDHSTVVPERSRVPPPPPSRLNQSRPPPPPSRHSGGAAAPALPPRMQNEDGTSNPPPPYPPVQSEHAYPTSNGAGHIEFSRFTAADKQAFFGLLDEVSPAQQ